MTPLLAAPVFIIAAPHAGDALLQASLIRASGAWRAHSSTGTFLEAVDGVDPATRGFDSHRLTAEDAAALAGPAREALASALTDPDGSPPAAESARPVAAGARLALRVPFLAEVFPDARFVFLTRDAEETLADMLTSWRSGSAVTVPALPGWDGPWSLPLVPNWRELVGAPLERVVVEQWRTITELALDDLEALGADRWCATGHERLLADPRGELRRLAAFLDLTYDQALLSPLEAAARARQAHRPPDATPFAEELSRAAAAVARVRALVGSPSAAPSRPDGDMPFASSFTASFPQRLRDLGSSLLISTYQTGRVVCARERDGGLNTHFRSFDKPMGMALAPGRLCLGTRTEVWDLRDMPEAAAKLEPPGSHDACFLPRNRHVTGDIAVHEMGFAGGELWIVATAFSCLATLDATHSFVPRWKPPFISAIAPGDRCHLNGMAIVDDQVRFVTALGRTDEPGAWRKDKAAGGLLMDVPTSEVVVDGLSMPHSPRWHAGRLWVLESGKGELCVVDTDAGRTETVIELPGFTRGLVFSGDTAFVGLSQIRESSTFGDLPLTQRLAERLCGVWMIDLARGAISGFLRFDDLVQEVFDVALLTGTRYPDIAEPASGAVATSYALP